MRFDQRLVGLVDVLDRLLERGPLRGLARRALRAGATARAKG